MVQVLASSTAWEICTLFQASPDLSLVQSWLSYGWHLGSESVGERPLSQISKQHLKKNYLINYCDPPKQTNKTKKLQGN